jgi:CheY-like chemotaxis protein
MTARFRKSRAKMERKKMTKTIEANKALVLEAFDTLFNKRDYKAAERYWSSNYIQHSAHIPSGRDGLFNLIRSAPADLRSGRFTMEFAQSGEMALQRIADAVEVSIILILSDINMPGMTGLELLPKAKAARPDVPVIMITAYGDAETKRKALEGGAEALFTKPIDFGALRNEIDVRVERAA